MKVTALSSSAISLEQCQPRDDHHDSPSLSQKTCQARPHELVMRNLCQTSPATHSPGCYNLISETVSKTTRHKVHVAAPWRTLSQTNQFPTMIVTAQTRYGLATRTPPFECFSRPVSVWSDFDREGKGRAETARACWINSFASQWSS